MKSLLYFICEKKMYFDGEEERRAGLSPESRRREELTRRGKVVWEANIIQKKIYKVQRRYYALKRKEAKAAKFYGELVSEFKKRYGEPTVEMLEMFPEELSMSDPLRKCCARHCYCKSVELQRMRNTLSLYELVLKILAKSHRRCSSELVYMDCVYWY